MLQDPCAAYPSTRYRLGSASAVPGGIGENRFLPRFVRVARNFDAQTKVEFLAGKWVVIRWCPMRIALRSQKMSTRPRHGSVARLRTGIEMNDLHTRCVRDSRIALRGTSLRAAGRAMTMRITARAVAVALAVLCGAACSIRQDATGVTRTGVGLWGFGDPPGVNWNLDRPRREVPDLPASRHLELPPRAVEPRWRSRGDGIARCRTRAHAADADPQSGIIAPVSRATPPKSPVPWLFALSIALSCPLAADAIAADPAPAAPRPRPPARHRRLPTASRSSRRRR